MRPCTRDCFEIVGIKAIFKFCVTNEPTGILSQKCFIDISNVLVLYFFPDNFSFFFSFQICTKSHNNWYRLVRVYPLILCMWDLWTCWKELLLKRRLEFAVRIAKWTFSCTAAVYIAIAYEKSVENSKSGNTCPTPRSFYEPDLSKCTSFVTQFIT